MKTGIELITEERIEQLEKHNWTPEHDANHTSNELIDAALSVLTLEDEYYPTNWDYKYFDKFCKKDLIGRLIVAGALLAAEIDRLNALK